MVVNTSDALAMPNDALQSNMTAFAPTTYVVDSSFQMAAAETIGPYDAVFGIFANWVFQPVPFFAIFNNSTDASVYLGYWTALPLVEGQSYDFILARTSGTVWQLSVNGKEFGGNASASTFDFRATQATWLGGLRFTETALYADQTTAPGFCEVPLAFGIHRASSGWYLPSSASTYFNGTTGAQWGLEGRQQHSSLAPGELDTGTQVPNVPDGTVLWSGGAAPVQVSLSLGLRATVATDPVPVVVRVTDPSGAPIPGVAVYLNDSLHGNVSTAALVTNGTGGAMAVLETPNVSANSTDLVQALVTSFGYLGSAGISLTLTPASQVLLSVASSDLTVAPGAVLVVTFLASDVIGHRLGGVFLTFAVTSGTAGLQPVYGATAGDGSLTVNVTAPPTPSTITLAASVAGGGRWGHVVVSVDVRQPAPSFLQAHGTEIGVGVGLAVIAGLVGVALWVRKRRRKPMPNLPIRQYWKEVRTAPPGATAGPKEPTRTPP